MRAVWNLSRPLSDESFSFRIAAILLCPSQISRGFSLIPALVDQKVGGRIIFSRPLNYRQATVVVVQSCVLRPAPDRF